MPYAANNEIAFDKFEGSIKITKEQYLQALEGMQEGLVVSIDGGFKVSPPAQAPTPIPTPEELAQQVLAYRDRLLTNATIRISPLQFAVDLGDESHEDMEKLSAWKQYCVALNRIQVQAGFPQSINWPVEPA
ncbi:tail fiber assembly protein [Pseudomonas proteolytica]|uniref:tail fiber assembly protein n=1 Tax=Pseudomonas proteolytica TaxID=219574 RepID=UPI001474BDEE|nr:tail fiber assembly protein [Pseudomonas proteolytica]NMY95624.1 tail fiber assembly protein [Pseudomonas proteolytica]